MDARAVLQAFFQEGVAERDTAKAAALLEEDCILRGLAGRESGFKADRVESFLSQFSQAAPQRIELQEVEARELGSLLLFDFTLTLSGSDGLPERGFYISAAVNTAGVSPRIAQLHCAGREDPRKLEQRILSQQREIVTHRMTLESLTNAIPGGICVLQRSTENIRCIFANDALAQMLGYGSVLDVPGMVRESDSMYPLLLSAHWIEDKQYPLLLEMLDRAKISHKAEEIIVQLCQTCGDRLWIKLRSLFFRSTDTGEDIFILIATDVNQLKLTEFALKNVREKMSLAMSKLGIACWGYTVKTDSIFLIAASDRRKLDVFPIVNPVAFYLESGDIHPNSEESLRLLYSRIRSGEKEGFVDIKVMSLNGAGWTNQRIFFFTDLDCDGAPVRALCVEKCMDELLYAQTRYEQVLQQYSALELDCILSWRINLSQKRVEYYHSRSGLEHEFTSINDLRSASRRALSLHLPEKERPVFINLLSLKRMKNDFILGKSESFAEFRWQRSSGEILYVSITVRVIDNPATQELIAFLYVRDVSDKKFWENALNAGREMTCDFISVIDTRTGVNRRINAETSAIFPPDTVPHDYERCVRRFVQTTVPKEERAKALSDMHIDSILAGLNRDGIYRHTANIIDPAGALQPKEWIYRYFDGQRQRVIYIRRDLCPGN